jgi:CRP-like cAMP-binding protein
MIAGSVARRIRRGEVAPKGRVPRETVALLQGVPLFSGLSKRDVRRIGGLARKVAFAPGRTIVERGVRGDCFYLVVDGTAKVYGSVVPTGRAIARLGPGEFFGEMALLDGGPHTATVVAETRVTAMDPRPSFRQLLLKEPAVSLRMLEEMAQRVARARSSASSRLGAPAPCGPRRSTPSERRSS